MQYSTQHNTNAVLRRWGLRIATPRQNRLRGVACIALAGERRFKLSAPTVLPLKTETGFGFVKWGRRRFAMTRVAMQICHLCCAVYRTGGTVKTVPYTMNRVRTVSRQAPEN